MPHRCATCGRRQPVNIDQHMLGLVSAWAKQRRIPKPRTPEGMRVLVMQFMTEFYTRAEQTFAAFPGGAAGDGTYAELPISRTDPSPQLLRTNGGLVDIASEEVEDSDFTDLVRDRAQALHDAGGDDLGQEALLLQQRRKAVNDEAPFVRAIVPQSMMKGLGGSIGTVTQPAAPSGAVIFGGQSPTPSVNGPQLQFTPVQVANWTGQDDIESMAVSVSFSPVEPPAATVGSALRPYGIVDFGNGSLQRLYVDIGSGIQLTVPASRVLLSVGLDPVAGVGIGSVLSTQIAGQIGFNPIVRTQPLTRTVYLDTLSAAVAKVWRPPFATGVMVVRNSPSSTSINLNFIDSQGTSLYEFDLATSANMTDPVPLTSDVVEIDVTKTGGSTAQARLVFFLSV